MARPTKTLADFVADGTFLARRHAHLLDDGPLVRDVELAKLQKAFRKATSDPERDHLARAFQRAAADGKEERASAADDELAAVLKSLGRPRSATQVVNFFPRFFVWDDGTPFRLDQFQVDFVKEAYRRDRRGNRVYKEILLGIPRGNGKTPLASGLSLHAMLTGAGRPKVFQIAGNETQAKLGVEYSQNWIADGDLSQWLRSSASAIRRRDGRGVLEILKASGSAAGRKPLVAIVDEPHEFTTKAQIRNIVAMQTALHKLEEAFLLAITTAGHDKGSWLGLEYDAAFRFPDVKTYLDGFLTIARDVENGKLMVWYGLPDGYDLDLEDDAAVMRAIALANPGSWFVGRGHRELLRALRRTTDPLAWIRENLNGWTKVAGAWVPVGAVRQSSTSTFEIPDGADVYVMVDASKTFDTTSVAWAWRGPDGEIRVDAYVWSVRAGAPAHEYVDDFYVAGEHVAERFIHQELAERFRVREVVADPNYFGGELKRLGLRFLTAELVPNGSWMRSYIMEFHRALSPASPNRLEFDVNNSVLREHIDGVAGAKSIDGYWVIQKLREANPIDGCVAAIGAFGRCLNAVRRSGLGFHIADLGVDDETDEDEIDEAALIRQRREREREAAELDDDEDDWED
jgi:phage terminase large subunit-like protein